MPPPRARVLVVDDRRDRLITLQALLEDVVDEIVLAASGGDALRVLLDPAEFALMLLDIEMPGMDGFELAEMVRRHRVHGHTPIIFVTASGDELHVKRCYALGAVDYVLTPIVPTVLRTKVSVLVELHRKTQQVRRQAEALERRAAQLHSLTTASVGVHAAGSVQEILRAAAHAARDAVGADVVYASAAPAGDQAPAHSVLVGSDAESTPVELRALSRLEAMVRHRDAPVRVGRNEAFRPEHRPPAGDDAVSTRPSLPAPCIGAPLKWSDGQWLGALQACGKAGGGDFDADEEAIVVQLAHVASVALQNRVLGDAREANRLKDEFFTNLSHELRNPLNAVVGWLQVLRRAADDAAGAERALSAIDRNTQLLSRLVDDLLDVSRIVGKRLTISTKPMALDEVVRTTVDSLRVTAEAKGVRLECRSAEQPIEVLGDGQRLTQVVWNLVSNALKSTARGGTVRVRVERDGLEAALVVEDDGEGIAPDFLPHVFERFRQAKLPQGAGLGGGLGLGLSIVSAVIDLHGGSVRADSAGVGRGAQFTVRLPLLPAKLTLDGYHVLLVDRDPESRRVMTGTFTALGAKVTAVADAAHAEHELDGAWPDVLVAGAADLRDDGTHALRWMSEQGAEIPVLTLNDGPYAPGLARRIGDEPQAPRDAETWAIVRAIRSIVPEPSPLS